MRKIFNILFILLALSSCSEDFLNRPTIGSVTDFNADEAVAGCYAAFYYNYGGGQSHWSVWRFPIYNTMMSDDGYVGGDVYGINPNREELGRFTVTPDNSNCGDYWNIHYKYIQVFNSTLEGLKDAFGITEEKKARYVAEVKFLRAYAYTNLMLFFGSKSGDLGIVKMTDGLTLEEKEKLGRTTWQESWDFILNDLTDAEVVLPLKSEYAISDLGRATKGAAQALKARIYMYTNNWEKCEEYAFKVIDSHEYDLEPDFADVFTPDHENGIESIWEIAYGYVSTDPNGGQGATHGGFYAAAQNPRNPFGQGWGAGTPSKDLLLEFEQDPGDPRIVWTLLFVGDEDTTQSGTQRVLTLTGAVSFDSLYNRKVWIPRSLWLPNNAGTEHNLRVLRYADILLLYAEALNENGKSGDALGYLNQVRERARNSSTVDPYRVMSGYPQFPVAMAAADRVPDVTTTDKAELRLAIWHERRVELALEGFRFHDLVRQGRAGEVLRAFPTKYFKDAPKGASFEDGKSESWPIPETTVTQSNGRIKQNPRY
ncbi:MAG: RagB/SusD family nutrient uptake outer membrane protein [Bacteroidales bacterium]|nr:RagB/SusD family nutrient uptake outer membrane protein [Bacteroidales bacterium]